jgi:Mg-chelatase subunit ChlD
MFKQTLRLMVILGLTYMSLNAKNIVVITDIAQGITKTEGIEVLTLIDPKKSPIYEDGDNFYGYVFTEKGRKKTNGKFVARGTNRKLYNQFYKKQYASYFKVVRAGVKQTILKEHKPKDILFLVDTSGSMKMNTQVDSIKKTIKSFVASKDKKVNVSIVVFDGHETFDENENARLLLDFTNDNGKINRAIEKISYSNFNTLYDSGFKKALAVLKKRKIKDKIVFLVSDGDDTSNSNTVLDIKKSMENMGIKIKPIAVGGASMNTLKKFSTNGNVYDATRGDMQSAIQENSNTNDPLFEKFAALSNTVFKKNNSKDDLVIIYSKMMEKSNFYDFYVVPNLSDDLFYNEVKTKLEQDHLNIDFNNMKVYVRLIGNPSAKKENEVRIFWERFIKDHNGLVKFISKDALTLDEMGY